MKKTLVIIITFTILTGCGQIEPIEKEIQKVNEININIDDNSAKVSEKGGIDLNEYVGVILEEENTIVKRFELLANNYKNHSDLMNSIQYENFVTYIHEVFEKYRKEGTKESDQKNNYIFDRLVPKIVIQNYVLNGIISEKESELIIQSIKRNDLNTLEDKKLLTEKFKIYFEENKYNPFIKDLDISGLSKEEKLKMITEKKEGLIYKILSNRYNWNKTGIGYKPSDMEADFMNYMNKKLENIFGVIGISELEVKNYIYKEYSINSLESLGKNILINLNSLIETYNLEGNIPLKRYYRNDERNDIFVDRQTVDKYIETLSKGKSGEFIEDIEKLRFKVYLLSYFGRNRTDLNEEQGLWSSRTRSDFIHTELGKGLQNLFRLSRYTPGEEVKIDLNKSTAF